MNQRQQLQKIHPADSNAARVRTTSPNEFDVVLATDGTNTICEVIINTERGRTVAGRGIARRRKGDKRDADVGSALALARAFQQAADNYRETAEALIFPKKRKS
jgi:hypothetical protein